MNSFKTSKKNIKQDECGSLLRIKQREIKDVVKITDKINPFKTLSQRNSVSTLRKVGTKKFLEKLAVINKDIAMKTLYNKTTTGGKSLSIYNQFSDATFSMTSFMANSQFDSRNRSKDFNTTEYDSYMLKTTRTQNQKLDVQHSKSEF